MKITRIRTDVEAIENVTYRDVWRSILGFVPLPILPRFVAEWNGMIGVGRNVPEAIENCLKSHPVTKLIEK